MASSIQEYCKKINRAVTFVDIVGLLCITIAFIVLFFIIRDKQKEVIQEVFYAEGVNVSITKEGNTNLNKPFGSKSGKTYTFSWCQASGRILAKNKIYFADEEEARTSGRTLSKLCQR